MSKIDTLSQTL